MTFHFGQLIAHLCKTRNVRAGSHRRQRHGQQQARLGRKRLFAASPRSGPIETIEGGAPTTGFMRHGDTIRIEMKGDDGQSVFGAIEQTVRPVAPAD